MRRPMYYILQQISIYPVKYATKMSTPKGDITFFGYNEKIMPVREINLQRAYILSSIGIKISA